MSSGQPVSQQISSVTRPLIVGLLALAAFSIGATLFLRSTFVEYRETANVTLTANAILENAMNAHMASLAWRNSKRPKYAQSVTESIANVRAELDAAQITDPQLKATLAQVDAGVQEYERDFNALLQAQTAFDTLESAQVSSRVWPFLLRLSSSFCQSNTFWSSTWNSSRTFLLSARLTWNLL